jgi:hypothetical protein
MSLAEKQALALRDLAVIVAKARGVIIRASSAMRGYCGRLAQYRMI